MKSWFIRHPLDKLELQRVRMSTQQLLPPQVKAILATPFPARDHDVRTLDALVVDFETTGLASDGDQVLSMGWVEIRQGVIRLNTAYHCLVFQDAEVNTDTVKVHHILPEALLARGIARDEAFERFFHAMKGKLLVAHGAVIERNFTRQYLKQLTGLDGVPLLWLDTLKIEQYRQQVQLGKIDWRLASIRQNYHLPDYPAHHALMDAIATAELYLAQLSSLFAKDLAPLGVLYNASR